MIFIFAKPGFGQPLIFFFISNFKSRYVLKTDRMCKKHPNRFCYICGHVVFTDRQAKITNFVKKTYQAYFGIELGDQDKPFASHICCKACGENLLDWRNKKRKSMPFGVPMVWREGKDHVTDCYFCTTNLRYQSQEQAPCSIPWCSICHKASPPWPRFLFLDQISPRNLVLILNLVIWLIELTVCGAKRTSNRCFWPKPISVIWPEPFQGIYPATWFSRLGEMSNSTWNNILLVSGTSEKKLDINSRLLKHLHWSTVTILLTWFNYLVWSMMLWNGDLSLTHLTEV